ncbi:MAG TPA: 4-alpha-glucanotransferase [Vicinamibacterales bacterium]|nr:4-alpha-glucanotransferase [Vicinamibacterales bacterium]
MTAPPFRRTAGVLVPLFSMRSSGSWGVGEFRDMGPFSAWMRDAGLSLLQLLPLNEMAPGQNSPYSALSSAAFDPLFISPDAIEAFARAGGVDALPKEARDALDVARRAPLVEFDAVRAAKRAAFDLAWDASRSGSDEAFAAFREREAWWLDDYALFRAVAEDRGADWTSWPQPLRERSFGTGGMPEEGKVARAMLGERIRFYAWLQWIAASQWADARAAAREQGVAVFGDVPFMVDAASADVWARQQDFMLDASVGTPPDAFSETGQDWGVPVYRWPEIAAGDFQWLRMRARRAADLFDGFRVDHLVGFYRTFVRRRDGEPYFVPAGEAEQIEQGERIMRLFLDTGAAVTAEDLGTVPDAVRASLARLGLPGYRILRWERRWHDEGQPFIHPSAWPAAAVATSGTHDTEALAQWWETVEDEERRQVAEMTGIRSSHGTSELRTFTPDVRDALLGSLYRSASNLLILPFQDLFGWPDRINTPATVGEGNWRWALPWPVDQLGEIPEANTRARELRDLAEETGRL